MTLDQFVAAGIYDPDAPNAAERREYLEYLLGRGHSADEILAAARHVNPDVLFHIAWDLQTPRRPAVSARQVAASAGVTLEDVIEVRACLAVPVTDPDAADVPEDFITDMRLFLAACDLYGRDRCLGFCRTMGAAVLSLAEGGRELVLTPLQERKATETEIAISNELAMTAWRQLEAMVGNLMREQTGRADWFSENLLRGEFLMGVGFVDLVSSTDWATTVGAQSQTEAMGRFEHAAVRLAAARDCRVVKFIGDEAMVVGRDPAHVAAIVVELCDFAADDDVLPSARAAVGFGPVTPRGGDYFGDVVNLVARANKQAPVGGVVATAEVVAHLARSQWRISAPETTRLRGIAGTVELYEIAADL